jgi:vitamin B12 transporter
MKSAVAYLLLAATIFVGQALAGEVDLDKIVITPGRVEQNIKGTTSQITVFNVKDIQDSKLNNLKDLIKSTPGLDIVQQGSFGGPVSVFLRGTNSGQTQIMIDNIRVYDPIATNAAFNLAHLPLNNIERIEIVRGAQSVLYGSDAMGGVINIITKKGKGRPSFSFLTGGGSYRSHKESLESSGKIENLAYALGVSHFYSRGISQLRGTTERDSYESNTLGIIARVTDVKYDYDNSLGLKDDPDLQGEEEQTVLSSYIENGFTDYWKQRIQYSFMRNYRQDSNDKDPLYPGEYLRDWYIGEKEQLDWQNTLTLSEFDTLILGFDWQREKGSYYYFSELPGWGATEIHFPKVISRTRGYYLNNMVSIKDKFWFNSGVRLDDHSYAGKKKSYKIDASYLFDFGTKLKGGWATAFKAPTLYQLHALPDPYFGGGNPNLQPEESQTYEAGFEQSAFGDKLNFGLVYFHTQLKNIIDAKYNPLTWYTPQYSNISKARIYGCELNLKFTPLEQFEFVTGYTWQDTEDKSNGDELLRRPKHKCFIDCKYIPNGKVDVGIRLIYVGRRSDSANRLLKAYSRVDINANYKMSINSELFLRIENFFDEIYEEAKNYAQPGRSFFAGIKLIF